MQVGSNTAEKASQKASTSVTVTFFYLNYRQFKGSQLLDSGVVTYSSLIHLFRSAGRVFSSSD
jgi:hypothetical protein